MGTQEFGSDDVLKHHERRLRTYSEEAIRNGQLVDSLIILHPGFVKGLEAIDRVYQLGSEFDIQTGLLLVGPPGSGKTTLLNYFGLSLPKGTLFDPSEALLAIKLARNPALANTLEEILTAQQYPLPRVSRDTVGAKRRLTLDGMRRHQTRLVAVDEAHNLCARSSSWPQHADDGTALTGYFREILDQRVGLVLSGGEELDGLAHRDKYLASRCGARCDLYDFQLNAEWAAVIKRFSELSCPVTLKAIYVPAQIKALHRATGGNLRRLKFLLVEAVLVATDRGTLTVEVQDLKRAFDIALSRDYSVVNPWNES